MRAGWACLLAAGRSARALIPSHQCLAPHLHHSLHPQIALVCQTCIIAAVFAILYSGMSPSKPGGVQDEIRWAGGGEETQLAGKRRGACRRAPPGLPRHPRRRPTALSVDAPTTIPSLTPRSLLFLCAITIAMNSTMGTLMIFSQERQVTDRERASRACECAAARSWSRRGRRRGCCMQALWLDRAVPRPTPV